MVVDASAILAVVLKENDYEVFADILRQNRGKLLVSPIGYWESWAKVDRAPNHERRFLFDQFQLTFPMLMVPIDQDQAYMARQARRTYGRGSGHPAKLNLGDCFAYALAKHLGKKLLFKGDDFRHTDVRAAL